MAERLTEAIDEAMAASIVEDGVTLRSAGALAGLSENAVGPRLAHTTYLGAPTVAARAPRSRADMGTNVAAYRLARSEGMLAAEASGLTDFSDEQRDDAVG